MRPKRLFFVLLYIIALILPSFLYIIKAININNDFLFLLSGVLGLTAYTLLSFQFLLMSRPKVIDKYVSLDRTYRFHMYIAVAAVILGYLHTYFKGLYFEDSTQTSIGEITLIIFISITIFSILLMVNKLFFNIKIIDSFKKFLNEFFKLKYETKVLIHNITLIGLILLFVHILMANSLNLNLPLKFILIIYSIIPLSLYLNHKIIKVFNINKRYMVSDIINEAKNIVTIKFTPITGKIFHYLPGQFLYLRLYNDDIPKDEHPFTISSNPSNSDYICTTIKKLGDFTNSLNKAKVGDKAYIDGGFGSFSYLKNPNANKICFIAGGIGITPFLSMLRYMSLNDRDKEVLLLWGARDDPEIICKNELNQYLSKLKNFNFIPVLSNDDKYEGEKGFIDISKLNKYIHNISEYDFYICGPPIMMKNMLNTLKKMGVSKQNIHFERFSI